MLLLSGKLELLGEDLAFPFRSPNYDIPAMQGEVSWDCNGEGDEDA